ncbi:MAG: biopolymer transporter ExbD [Candidatus Tectomicrobia bacterium]|uniref:Biopolymer transporter ExbD n=1 Tax=Tectimicrobiota bacterium TaxID=2528274 RepID=A0A932MMY2_UNCTE|nr:biopolymer transporter ExbD [Candidatus Tectomicrobia bacterium]
MRFRELRRVQAEPGMTALIDTVFLLLLFFALSSSFVMQVGISVNLPRTVSSETAVRKDVIVVVARDGRIFVNNEEVPFDSLWGRLIEELRVQPEGALILRADRDVPHGQVVRVMDVAKQAGAGRIAIATEPARKDEIPGRPAPPAEPKR